ncbi:MAG: thiolase family protein [Gammaproteobacteria bacterium]|nr:MAG: thiolase family protein [Gammaproteobacteria bacterium]
MNEAVILGAVRTPFGKRDGVYAATRPDSLLAHTLQALTMRVGINAGKIEDVITGNVTQIGEQGANIARQSVLLAGFPVTVPGVSLNRMCGSGQQAVHFAAQAVAAGDVDYAIGAGVESMTRVPMFSDLGGGFADGNEVRAARQGRRVSGFETLNPKLLERYELIHQGESAERIAGQWSLTRSQLDQFAAESHRRASAAFAAGRHGEIVLTPGNDDAGNPISVSRDQGVRDHIDPDKMAQLPTVFRPAGNGVITAGNASQIADGAAAVLVARREIALAEGFRPLARFRARVAIGDDPTLQLMGVVPATKMALARAQLALTDLDWIEINEAFACVVLAWAQELGPDMDKVNPWGGAIAHGHPLGATGAGLMAKMLAGLEATDGQFGLQVMCIGHGMATATIIERI